MAPPPPKINAAKRKTLELLARPGNKSQFLAFRVADFATTWAIEFEDIKAAIMVLFDQKAIALHKWDDKRGFIDFTPGSEMERWFFYHSNFEMKITHQGLALLEEWSTEEQQSAQDSANTFGFDTADRSAAVLVAASGLWSLRLHGGMYPQDLAKPGPSRLRELFTQELETSLAAAKQADALEIFRRTKTMPDSDEYMAAIFGPMLTAMLAIQKQLGCSENEAHTRAQVLCPKTLQDAVKTLHEVMVFDFQIPAPADIPEYKSRERFFFLLGKYWEVYRAFLTHYMMAEGGYTPDPLMRFIMNLKARIGVCLQQLGGPEFSEPLSQLVQIEFGEDVSMHDDWVKERINSVDEAIEAERLRIGTLHFELTAQEKLFIETAMLSLENVKKQLTAWFSGVLNNAKEQAQEWGSAGGRPDPHQTVGKVETAFRRIIQNETKVRFKNGWLDFIKKGLSPEVFSAAEERMAARKVKDPDEIIHFLYLKDLRELISVEWSIFHVHFSLQKKRWNELMDIILKGRTDSAHFRPEHLWPEVEQSRLRIACHDVLAAMKADVNFPPDPQD
jgi:hypothetical protein